MSTKKKPLPGKERILESVLTDLISQKQVYEKFLQGRRGKPILRPPDPQTQYAYLSVCRMIMQVLKSWSPKNDKDLAVVARDLMLNVYGIDRGPIPKRRKDA